MSVDPLVIMSTISAGLKLIDQFRELALRFFEKKPEPPSEIVEQVGDVIQRKHYGQVVQEIGVDQIHLNEWDDTRYRALERRVRLNWDYYNELFSQEPLLAVDDRARIKLRMETTRRDLCTDFREMVTIAERTLGISLPDHYTLHEVCRD